MSALSILLALLGTTELGEDLKIYLEGYDGYRAYMGIRSLCFILS